MHLSEGEHAAEEGIAGIVAAALVAKHRHAMVNTHGERRVLLLEDARQLDDVGTSAQVGCLGEVAVGEDVARAQMHEMSARGILARQGNHVVLNTCRERTRAEREPVVGIVHRREEPLDVLV